MVVRGQALGRPTLRPTFKFVLQTTAVNLSTHSSRVRVMRVIRPTRGCLGPRSLDPLPCPRCPSPHLHERPLPCLRQSLDWHRLPPHPQRPHLHLNSGWSRFRLKTSYLTTAWHRTSCAASVPGGRHLSASTRFFRSLAPANGPGVKSSPCWFGPCNLPRCTWQPSISRCHVHQCDVPRCMTMVVLSPFVVDLEWMHWRWL